MDFRNQRRCECDALLFRPWAIGKHDSDDGPGISSKPVKPLQTPPNRDLYTPNAEQQSRLLRLGSKAMDVYEEALDSEDLGIALATATKILEGTGVLNKEGLQGTIDQAVNRKVVRSTPVLPEFRQGPEEFVRRDDEPTPRMPPTPVLQIVPGDGTDDDGGS